MYNIFKRLFYTKFNVEIAGAEDFNCTKYIYLKHFPHCDTIIAYHDKKNKIWYYLEVIKVDVILNGNKQYHSLRVFVEKQDWTKINKR